MRAWILEEQARVEQRPLKLVEMPTPHPEGDEVRIKVVACGVCRTDIHIAEGDLALKKAPIILGHEIVGIVDKVGEKAQRFQAGDRAGVYWLHSACGQCKYCLSGRENYCPHVQCTGWDQDGGYAEYVTVPEAYALPLNDVRMDAMGIAPLMCPGIAGYAAFKLAGVQEGDRLGLYGFGPTAYCVLKVAQAQGIETYVSTRSQKNIDAALREGAHWAANAAKEEMPCKMDGAILFPPAGNLVEPVLSQLEEGGVLVMAPVSASPITIEDYSANLWGRDIRTLYNLKRSDAEEFFAIVDQLDLRMGTTMFPFEELPDALVLAKQGKLPQPNAVLEIGHSI
ncbi:MAG: zinc-binding alcohol dehydrogenase family protein [Anaerolineae bacterium]